jgi:hypothetical protein
VDVINKICILRWCILHISFIKTLIIGLCFLFLFSPLKYILHYKNKMEEHAANRIVDAVFKVLIDGSKQDYIGEKISQLEHSLQAAASARQCRKCIYNAPHI